MRKKVLSLVCFFSLSTFILYFICILFVVKQKYYKIHDLYLQEVYYETINIPATIYEQFKKTKNKLRN